MIELEDQIKCVERELALRKAAYPKWVAGGRMKREKADREVAAMAAVLETLKHLWVVEHPTELL